MNQEADWSKVPANGEFLLISSTGLERKQHFRNNIPETSHMVIHWFCSLPHCEIKQVQNLFSTTAKSMYGNTLWMWNILLYYRAEGTYRSRWNTFLMKLCLKRQCAFYLTVNRNWKNQKKGGLSVLSHQRWFHWWFVISHFPISRWVPLISMGEKCICYIHRPNREALLSFEIFAMQNFSLLAKPPIKVTELLWAIQNDE